MRGLAKRLLAALRPRPPETGPSSSGAAWEDYAAKFLEDKGLKVVARNVRTRRSELDIVAVDGDTTVFVEVKARNTGEFGGPAASLDRRKRQRLRSAAHEFLSRRKLSNLPCRFDAVFILTCTDPPEVEHVIDAFGDDL